MIVTIQQASNNALAAYLATAMPDVSVTTRWPNPDKDLPEKAITILLAGTRRDEQMDLRQLSATPTGSTKSTVVWQLAMCIQPVQLDVWARSDLARDDILAQLDRLLHAGESALVGAFNPDPVGHSVLLAVQDGWDSCGTTVDFDFDGPELQDTASAIGSRQYRATLVGDAHFALSLTTLTARQKVITFAARMKDADGSFSGDFTSTT